MWPSGHGYLAIIAAAVGVVTLGIFLTDSGKAAGRVPLTAPPNKAAPVAAAPAPAVASAAAPTAPPVPVSRAAGSAGAVLLSGAWCGDGAVVSEPHLGTWKVVGDYHVSLDNQSVQPIFDVRSRLLYPLRGEMVLHLDSPAPIPVLAAGNRQILLWDLRRQRITRPYGIPAAALPDMFVVEVRYLDADGRHCMLKIGNEQPQPA